MEKVHIAYAYTQDKAFRKPLFASDSLDHLEEMLRDFQKQPDGKYHRDENNFVITEVDTISVTKAGNA